VLAVVFQVRILATGKPGLDVLLWQRALSPQRGRWSLPGGQLGDGEDLTASVRRQLAEKVDLREVAHLEQLAVFSDPGRVPGTRVIASTFLGLVPSPATPELPSDTRWHPVSDLPPMAFDHEPMVSYARSRLAAKLSYTNLGFALAPKEFALSTLRGIYGAKPSNRIFDLDHSATLVAIGYSTYLADPRKFLWRCKDDPRLVVILSTLVDHHQV
jgi:ADP-ribose pyrophosphatase YjhB (NUDIX family)